MSTILDPTTLTQEQLAELQARLEGEHQRRHLLTALAGEYERHVTRIRTAAEAGPVVAFSPVPSWGGITGHPPGQRVEHAGKTYVNNGRCFLAELPGTSTDWIEPPPPTEPPVETPPPTEPPVTPPTEGGGL
ncbi:hypothetical protein [Timonella sp. A28]|uniref:hypothetical protein n=1 Tax=Timonella sp. A28 TaxID=3442640 RepID=UPI003EBB5D88